MTKLIFQVMVRYLVDFSFIYSLFVHIQLPDLFCHSFVLVYLGNVAFTCNLQDVDFTGF